jgi:hypothetical protein
VPDSFTVTATGAPTPTLTESGALPLGVSFTADGYGMATVAGDAAVSGRFPITIKASNGVSPAIMQSFVLTVNPAVTSWSRLSPNASPGALGGSSMAYDPTSHQLLQFGGSSTGGYSAATWDWNGTTWAKLTPATSPPARNDASMAFDAATGQLLLFGGVGANAAFFNDTWDWNGSTWVPLIPATAPPVRYNASMAYDPATSQLLLFGGVGSSTATGGDTWTWNGSTWADLTPASSPSPRSHAPLAYDPATAQLILFGGTSATGGTALGDTWTWTGTTWTRLSPAASPSPRYQAAVTYDPTTRQLILFGGSGRTALGDTWLWTGTTWTQLTPAASPSARYRPGMAFDPATSQLLLYGGSANADTYLGDTWSYGPVPPVVPTAPTIGAASAIPAQATVTFDPPANNGGSAVTRYTVTAADETTPANGGQTARGSASPVTVTGLHGGDTYTFTVVATNAVGTGPASSASNAVTLPAVPGAPVIGTATAGNAQASVSFTPPAGNGGSAVTSYTVTAADGTTSANGGQTATGTASPITVTGLTNGDRYTVTVTATNAAGTGPPSAASNAITPATVPDAPVIGTATAGNAQASLSFTPPVNNGGSDVTGYTVTAADGTTPANGGQTATGTASPITVTGLTNGDRYTFAVTATNAAGTGPASAASNTVTPVAPLSIASVMPGQLATGTSITVVIDGTGFVAPLNVAISGGGVTPALLGVTSIAVTITASVSASALTGPRDVTVTDANGMVTCTGCLNVIAAPKLSSISPSSLAQGASTVTGDDRATANVVSII